MDRLYLNANGGCPIAQCDLGFHYYKLHNIPESIRWYELSAQKGSINSLRSLGFIYLDNIRDIDQAIYYFTLSALRDDDISHRKLKEINVSNVSARSKCLLGFYYYKMGNNTKALKWYLASASQGCTDANYDLGHLYWKGTGVEQDFNKALDHFLISANNNRLDAQYMLGFLYMETKNLKMAYEWFSLAANNGEPNSKEKLRYFKNMRKQIKSKLQQYIEKNTGEGISYLFFCNFMLFLSNDLKDMNDPLLSSWITKYLTKYFVERDPNFDDSVIQTWFDELY